MKLSGFLYPLTAPFKVSRMFNACLEYLALDHRAHLVVVLFLVLLVVEPPPGRSPGAVGSLLSGRCGSGSTYSYSITHSKEGSIVQLLKVPVEISEKPLGR